MRQNRQGGWKAKIRLLSQARQFSDMILSLGQRVVPGLDGPTPEEILLPTILEDRVLAKYNLVGFRPTYGLLSRSGIQPSALTQDMAGSLTRAVADSAVMLNVLAGVDPNDSVTKGAEGHIEKDYTQFLDKNALKGKRIGVVREFVGTDPDQQVLVSKVGENKQPGRNGILASIAMTPAITVPGGFSASWGFNGASQP